MPNVDKETAITEQILKYIDEHYTDPMLSADMIADAVGLSKNYVRNKFKSRVGISISDYITEKRFGTLCRLLVETDMTAKSIAGLVGLNPENYFYTAFKRYTGYTTEQYRNLFAKSPPSDDTPQK